MHQERSTAAASIRTGLEQEVFVVNENRAWDGWEIAARGGTWGWVGGATFGAETYVLRSDGSVVTRPSGYSPYRNFTAKDLKTHPNGRGNSWVSVQVWELGNSLGMITEKRSVSLFERNPRDESGKLFTNCVRKKYGRSF